MNRNHCAVTADLNRYLKQLDQEDAREHAIERLAADLMLQEYAPDTEANVIEALLETTDKVATAITPHLKAVINEKNAAIRANLYALIGKVIVDRTLSYWEDTAREQAIRDIDNADCPYCYDQGCRKCEGDY